MSRALASLFVALFLLTSVSACKKRQPKEPAKGPATAGGTPAPGPVAAPAPAKPSGEMPWEKAVRSSDPAIRAEALATVPPSHLRPPRIVLKALGDRSPAIRKAAVRGIVGFVLQYADTSALPKLLEMARKDKDVGVRAEAVRALGAASHRRIVPALCKQLAREQDAEIRSEILAILARSGDRRARPTLRRLLQAGNPSAQVFQALGQVESTATPGLLAFLGHRSPQLRRQAAQTLGEIGDPAAAPKLIGLLKDSDSKVVVAALGALAALSAKEAVAPVLALCDHSDATLRAHALEALGAYRNLNAITNEAFPKIVKLLAEDKDLAVRVEAARALAGLHLPQAVAPLAEAASSRNPEDLRVAALQSLGHSGATTALPTLTGALGDANVGVRVAAARAIGSMGAAARAGASALLAAWKKESDLNAKVEILRSLGQVGATEASPLLVEVGTKDPVSLLRVIAGGALLRMERPEGISVIRPLLTGSKEWQERREAARALEARRWRERREAAKTAEGQKFAGAVAHLILNAVRTEKEPQVLETLYGQLGKAHGPIAAKAQRLALNTRVPYFRLMAAAGLCRSRDRAGCRILVKALRSPDAVMRAEAARRVGWYRLADARPALERLKSDPVLAVAAAARRTLRRLSKPPATTPPNPAPPGKRRRMKRPRP